MQPLHDETIAAIATARGTGGLAVVRCSGPRALTIADRVWSGRRPLAEAAGHTLHHGWVVAPGSGVRLDEAVAAVFRGPRSYTCENVVEFSCHGGDQPAGAILAALLDAGARLARPGEFTQRAFLHGRIDLAQAEAVADLIGAGTDAARAQALAQLDGALSRRLAAIGEALADAMAEIEARVDFAEDVDGVEVPAAVRASLAAQQAALDDILAGAAWARAVREGARVPLVGRPNAGKSSLFNRLLGTPRALVSEFPGTTRDRVTEALDLEGVRVTLVDTAGVHEAPDAVERMGVALSLESLADAPLVVWVVDGSRALTPADLALTGPLGNRQVIVALTHADLPCTLAPEAVAALLEPAPRAVVAVSAVTGDGVGSLRGAIARALGADRRGLDASAANERQGEALGRARDAVARAAQAAAAGLPGELVAADLRLGLDALGEVTGATIGADLLDRIFSRFCIGK